MHCTNCGSRCGENARFCTECGAPIPVVRAAGPAPVSPGLVMFLGFLSLFCSIITGVLGVALALVTKSMVLTYRQSGAIDSGRISGAMGLSTAALCAGVPLTILYLILIICRPA